MIKIAKQLLKWMLSKIPFKSQIISLGARLPPPLKTKATMRLLAIIAGFLPKEMHISTNLGISQNYDISVSNISDHGLYLFGRPEHYIPERGALFLANALTNYSTAFIDIGSHKGYYIFYVREGNPYKSIFFFEPHPDLFEQIKQDVSRNHINLITGFNMAVGAKSGQTQFYMNKTSLLEGSLKEYAPEGHEIIIEQIEITTFDDFVNKYELNNICVKVDIENAEFEFLHGARGSLRNHVSYLIIEVLDRAIEGGFVEKMIEKGFSAYYINDFSLEYTNDGHSPPVHPQYNWLFCRLSPRELRQKLSQTPFIINEN